MSSKTFYWFVILSLLLVNFPKAHGQNYAVIDSLQKENLIESSTNKKVNKLLSIADEYSHYNTDSTFFYIETALHLARETGYKAGTAEAHFLKSYYYDLIGNYDTAIVHLENATELFIEVGDSSYLSGSYNNLGVLYSYGTNQKKSLEYFIKSAQIGEMLQDSFSLAESYSNIAGFYEELKEYSSALIYFKKALLVDKHYNSKENIAISHLDIGYMNIKLRRFNEALENLKVAQKLMAAVEDPFYQIILYQRLANYYSENANLDSAMFYLVKAQQQSSKLNAPILSAESLSIKSSMLL
jgi:tetratricopeptide (TPR) repeat protein